MPGRTRRPIERLPQAPGLDGPSLALIGRGLRGLHAPATVLDARNSGTTLRLLSGILAAHPFTATLTGDESLRRRPMRRIIEPLGRMGAQLAAERGCAPLTIRGGVLRPIDYVPPVPSAQVKSAVLLAGLQTDGTTTVREAVTTRDHTERGLLAFGVEVARFDGGVSIEGLQRLTGIEATVPGDMSSATFWAVAAAALPGIGRRARRRRPEPDADGAPRRAGQSRSGGRAPAGARRARGTSRQCPHTRRHLRPLALGAEDVPALIDELPALAAMATHGGDLHVTGAGELRVKESDRISALAAGLRALGADIEEFPDGFHVRGRRLKGGVADASGDHRLAMAFAVAALGRRAAVDHHGGGGGCRVVPAFFETLAALTR